MTDAPRLTALAHGGGCGCKLDPAILRRLLADQPAAGPFERLLVGSETADDAAVWELDDGTRVIASDFFTPMVDDPADFGRIAATNAISDVYAMGGRPIFALAILGMPVGKIAPEDVAQILRGGAEKCAEAGIPVVGGHSIDTPEPIYGLAVIGTCRRDVVRRNADALTGDAVILTKPLGVGIYSAAIKREALDAAEHGRNCAGRRAIGPRAYRRDRVRHPGPRARDRPRGRPDTRPRRVRPAAASKRRGADPSGFRHRRLAPELGRLRGRGRFARRRPGVAAAPADRSTDFRRTAGDLRGARAGSDPGEDPDGR